MTILANSIAAHLERYRALGFSTIPITPPGNGDDGKHPAMKWKRFQTEHATDAEIADWFSTPMSIGIVTGAISNIVVIDLDSEAARRWFGSKWPYTPWQVKTPRPGFHVYFRHPGVEVRNKAKLETGSSKLDLDVRGDGGFVVAPPSAHEKGGRYQLAGDWSATIDDIPIFDPAWLARPTPVVDPDRIQTRHLPHGYASARSGSEIPGGHSTARYWAGKRHGDTLRRLPARAGLWDLSC